MNDVLKFIKDCYINDKTLFVAEALVDKKFSLTEWQNTTGDTDVLSTVLTKKKIIDIIMNEPCDFFIHEEFIFSLGNLSLIWDMTLDGGVGVFTSEDIIEKKVKIREFHKHPDNEGHLGETTEIEIYPISELKFNDIFEYFRPNYDLMWAWFHTINFCDHLGIKLKTIGESPADFNVEEIEFQEFYEDNKPRSSPQELKEIFFQVSRLFRKPIEHWTEHWTSCLK